MNPERPKDGRFAPVGSQVPGFGLLGWAAVTVAAFMLILLVTLLGPPTSGGFIYEQF